LQVCVNSPVEGVCQLTCWRCVSTHLLQVRVNSPVAGVCQLTCCTRVSTHLLQVCVNSPVAGVCQLTCWRCVSTHLLQVCVSTHLLKVCVNSPVAGVCQLTCCRCMFLVNVSSRTRCSLRLMSWRLSSVVSLTKSSTRLSVFLSPAELAAPPSAYVHTQFPRLPEEATRPKLGRRFRIRVLKPLGNKI